MRNYIRLSILEKVAPHMGAWIEKGKRVVWSYPCLPRSTWVRGSK